MAGLANMLFGKKLSPDDMVKKWRADLRTQQREIDRNIRNIEQEEAKAKILVKQAAKRNDLASCRTMAKEVARSRKARDRMHTSKAQLNSVLLQLQQQAAQVKIAGTLQKSSEIMGLVNRLVRVQPVQESMRAMQTEMIKAGIIDEMMDEVTALPDEDDIEEAADQEVSNVLFELTNGVLGQAGKVGGALPEVATATADDEAAEAEADRILRQMEASANQAAG